MDEEYFNLNLSEINLELDNNSKISPSLVN